MRRRRRCASIDVRCCAAEGFSAGGVWSESSRAREVGCRDVDGRGCTKIILKYTSMIKFTRTFHPVGQGAFYSEEFELPDNGRFRIVYDCGSKTLSKSDLKRRIKSDFAGDMNVDILFISHFDEDHISGVEFLKPKTVVVPFLSEAQILLLTLYNRFQKGTYNVNMAKNPQETFPDAQLIQILPYGSDSDSDSDFDPIFDLKAINGSNRDDNSKNSVLKELRKVKSLAPINILQDKLFWEYIPYNPNWDKYAELFKSEITQHRLDWNQLVAPDNGDYIKDNVLTLKKVYNKLKQKNLHSLVVCSSSKQDVKLSCYCEKCKYCLIPPCKLNLSCGCIYFGDAKVDAEWRDDFYDYLKGLDLLEEIGTLQVPHHGSNLSYGWNIIPPQGRFANPVRCIISIGEFNHYGHPSARVIRELLRKGGRVSMVTEAVSSMFIQTASLPD